jgi:membrane-bound inhibitor of C-type lysozyme
MLRTILAVGAIALAASCSPKPGEKTQSPVAERAPAVSEKTVLNWTCENGDAFRMTILEDRADFVFRDGITATMAPAMAASGNLFKASNGTDLFHTKGNEGFLQFGGKETNCTTPDLGE